jgi:hypothetical protein
MSQQLPHRPPAYRTFMPVHPAPPRSPSGLATAALVVGGLWILVQVACVITVWPAVDEYSRASSLGIDAADVWTAYDTMNLLVLPFALATYVVACGWLHSARKAACVISPGVPHARSWLWVWLGWWVPVVSFWFPYQVVRDVRRASVVRDPAGIGPWWAMWLALTVLSVATRGLTPTAGLPGDARLHALAWTEGVYSLVLVVAIGLWARIVWEIRTAQRTFLG